MELFGLTVNLQAVVAAIILMIFDVISGLLAAFTTGTYKSKIMRQGGFHKLMLMLTIFFGIFLDWCQLVMDLGVNIPTGAMICIYISIMEICSTIENINKGFPGAIPVGITKLFDTKLNEYTKDVPEPKLEPFVVDGKVVGYYDSNNGFINITDRSQLDPDFLASISDDGK